MIQPKIISNTINLLISKLIPAVLLTLINILFSRSLSHTDYGVYQAVWSFISVFVILTTFGIPRYIMTFGSIYKHDKSHINQLLLITFALTLIPVAFYIFFYYDNFDLTAKLLCLALLLSQSFYLIQEANIISLLHNQLLVKSNVIYALLLFISHAVILYILGYKLHYCLTAILLISLLRNAFVWKLSSSFRVQNAAVKSAILLNKMQLFWFGLNDSLQILTKWFDKIILLVFLPAADYAVYFNGTFEIPLIGMALTAFQSIITSFSAQTPNEETKHVSLFYSSSLFMSGLLFPLFAYAFFYSKEIVVLFFGSTYQDAAQLFAISALMLPLRICSYTVLLQLKEKGMIIFIGSIIDFAAAVLLMIILYPYLKLAGLALAVVIATYIQALFYMYHIGRSYSISLNALIPLKQLAVRFILTISIFYILHHWIIFDFEGINFLIASITAPAIAVFYSRKAFRVKHFFSKN